MCASKPCKSGSCQTHLVSSFLTRRRAKHPREILSQGKLKFSQNKLEMEFLAEYCKVGMTIGVIGEAFSVGGLAEFKGNWCWRRLKRLCLDEGWFVRLGDIVWSICLAWSNFVGTAVFVKREISFRQKIRLVCILPHFALRRRKWNNFIVCSALRKMLRPTYRALSCAKIQPGCCCLPWYGIHPRYKKLVSCVREMPEKASFFRNTS